jgi:hypothetical protein
LETWACQRGCGPVRQIAARCWRIRRLFRKALRAAAETTLGRRPIRDDHDRPVLPIPLADDSRSRAQAPHAVALGSPDALLCLHRDDV